jgi:hypothetical protein
MHSVHNIQIHISTHKLSHKQHTCSAIGELVDVLTGALLAALEIEVQVPLQTLKPSATLFVSSQQAISSQYIILTYGIEYVV